MTAAAERCFTCDALLDPVWDADGCRLCAAFAAKRATAVPAAFAADVRRVCDEIADLLITKNRQYGNSALDPMRVFSKADPIEQIKVRIDDKLSRLARGQMETEDAVKDLMGYLVLLRIAEGTKHA